jgi:hypothetical protein
MKNGAKGSSHHHELDYKRVEKQTRWLPESKGKLLIRGRGDQCTADQEANSGHHEWTLCKIKLASILCMWPGLRGYGISSHDSIAVCAVHPKTRHCQGIAILVPLNTTPRLGGSSHRVRCASKTLVDLWHRARLCGHLLH